VSLEMHFEAVIEQTERCTLSCDPASIEMHLQQAMIEGDEYLEVIDLEAVVRRRARC